MTAFAFTYHADMAAVASDTLVYGEHGPIGCSVKVAQLPHIRALFLGHGWLQIAVGAVAGLLLRPNLSAVEDAATALPNILASVTGHLMAEQGVSVDGLLDIFRGTLIGWSPAEQRMRLWQFVSSDDYRPRAEADRMYGGPFVMPGVPNGYLPLDRGSDSLATKLIGMLRGIDRYAGDHPEHTSGTRLGGDITLTTVSETGIEHRVIGRLPNHADALTKGTVH